MLSDKQIMILSFPYSDYDAIICDGAVRSGKTSVMTVSFIDWAMRNYSECRFGICGKTADSAIKNIVIPFLSMSYSNKYKLKWHRTDRTLEITCGAKKNVFEVFGGKDESSFALIQGRTLGGVMFDEVALMPENFVLQAIARCSLEGARLWFNCNPDSPQHWFYKEWIKRAEERNALYIHFSLEDNPSLSEKTLNRYRNTYSGAFYERYILGRWVACEGLVYDLPQSAVVSEYEDNGEYYISCDYGTLNPFSAGLWCVNGDTAVRIDEFYHDGRAKKHQLTDEEYYSEIVKLAGERHIRAVVIDPSAASFIALIHKKGRFRVKKANNDVMSGIHATASFLREGKLKIHKNCKNAIREFGLYRWDEQATADRVIKENDHAMDDIRYFCMSVLTKKQQPVGEIPLFY